MKADQERVSKLLTDTVTLLCKNGLIYGSEIKVQGLLGITLDRSDVFIVHIDETIGGTPGGVTGLHKDDSSPARKRPHPGSPASAQNQTGANFVDLTRLTDTPMMTPAQIAAMQGMAMMGAGGRRPRLSSQAAMMSHMPQQAAHMLPPRGQYMAQRGGARMSANATMHLQQQQGANNHMMYQRGAGGAAGGLILPPLTRGGYGGRGNFRHVPRHGVAIPTTVHAASGDDEDVVIVGEGPGGTWGVPSGGTAGGSMRRGQYRRRQPMAAIRHVSAPPANGGAAVRATGVATATGSVGSPMGSGAAHGDSFGGASAGGGPHQPEFVLLNSIGGVSFDGAVEGGGVEGEGPVVYTDVDGGEEPVVVQPGIAATADHLAPSSSPGGGGAESMDIQAPGFDILTAEEDGGPPVPVGDPGEGPSVRWPCRFEGCTAAFLDAAHLANHYTVMHAEGGEGAELVRDPVPSGPATPNPAGASEEAVLTQRITRSRNRPGSSLASAASDDSSRPPSAADSNGSDWSNDGDDEAAAKRRRKRSRAAEGGPGGAKNLRCPWPEGCEKRFCSYPGLYLHHKNAHGRAPTVDERRAVLRGAAGGRAAAAGGSGENNEDDAKRRVTADDGDVTGVDVDFVTAVERDAEEGRGGGEDDADLGADGGAGRVHGGARNAAVGGEKRNFLCLFNQCEVSCESRERLIAHLQTAHGSMGEGEGGESGALKEEELGGEEGGRPG